MRYRLVFALPALLLSFNVVAVEPGNIKKCQDTKGRWHYGDNAARECTRSDIVEMSEQGVTKKVTVAPPTAADLAKRKDQLAEEERKKEAAAEQKRNDQLLLATYGHEDDIIFVRDRKLAQIEASIAASEGTLKSLRASLTRQEAEAAEDSGDPKALAKAQKIVTQTKTQITKHEEAIATQRKDQEAIRVQADADLKRYREIKGAKLAEPATSASAPAKR